MEPTNADRASRAAKALDEFRHAIGEAGPQKRDMVFALNLADAEEGGEGLRREWVAQKIYKLINDHMASGRAETVQEIRNLSAEHNVPLPYGADFPL